MVDSRTLAGHQNLQVNTQVPYINICTIYVKPKHARQPQNVLDGQSPHIHVSFICCPPTSRKLELVAKEGLEPRYVYIKFLVLSSLALAVGQRDYGCKIFCFSLSATEINVNHFKKFQQCRLKVNCKQNGKIK